jgi:hypothetical protein
MRERGIILTEGLVLGLFFVQRYRFLTINQFARAAGMHRDTASRQLRNLELRGVLSHFGNACLPGHGRTPKVYFLTRKGWELLLRESDIPPELLGSHKEVKVDSRWSPQMYHRLRTVDLMISAEVALFFLEMDMGTERVVSQITRDNRISLFYKLSQYDRYLQALPANLRQLWGFSFLHTPLENIRREMRRLPPALSEYYRLTTYERAMGDFFSPIWKSRLATDTRTYGDGQPARG